MPIIEYPTINGQRYDFSSIEANAGGMIHKGYEEISYSHKMEPGEARGTHQVALGDTPGEYSAEGSLTMLKTEYQEWIERLGRGYMRKRFNMTVSYGDDGSEIIVDELLRCRIKSSENQHQKGNEPLKVKVSLWIGYLREGGVDPVPDPID